MPYDPLKHGPQRIVGPGFHEQVYEVVQSIPPGQVATYGDIGGALGSRGVARQVGYALAALPPERDDVPWYRVVNAQGKISDRVEGSTGASRQERALRKEGVKVDERGRVVGFSKRRVQGGL